MSEDIYEDGTLDIGTYAGTAGGDRLRFQITAWVDGERRHVVLTRDQALRVAFVLTANLHPPLEVQSRRVSRLRPGPAGP